MISTGTYQYKIKTMAICTRRGTLCYYILENHKVKSQWNVILNYYNG